MLLCQIKCILDASIKCKPKFDQQIRREFKNLIPVSVPKWAGIGAVRYIPDYLLEKLDDIEKHLAEEHANDSSELDKCIDEINELNEQLVKALQHEDGAFSIGIASDTMKAVKLGMVSDCDAFSKLVARIQTVGKSVEESQSVSGQT